MMMEGVRGRTVRVELLGPWEVSEEEDTVVDSLTNGAAFKCDITTAQIDTK